MDSQRDRPHSWYTFQHAAETGNSAFQGEKAARMVLSGPFGSTPYHTLLRRLFLDLSLKTIPDHPHELQFRILQADLPRSSDWRLVDRRQRLDPGLRLTPSAGKQRYSFRQ